MPRLHPSYMGLWPSHSHKYSAYWSEHPLRFGHGLTWHCLCTLSRSGPRPCGCRRKHHQSLWTVRVCGWTVSVWGWSVRVWGWSVRVWGWSGRHAIIIQGPTQAGGTSYDYIFTSLVPRPFFATQGKWSGEQPIPISFHMPECWQAN